MTKNKYKLNILFKMRNHLRIILLMAMILLFLKNNIAICMGLEENIANALINNNENTLRALMRIVETLPENERQLLYNHVYGSDYPTNPELAINNLGQVQNSGEIPNNNSNLFKYFMIVASVSIIVYIIWINKDILIEVVQKIGRNTMETLARNIENRASSLSEEDLRRAIAFAKNLQTISRQI